MATPEIPHLISGSQRLRAESMLVAAYRSGRATGFWQRMADDARISAGFRGVAMANTALVNTL